MGQLGLHGRGLGYRVQRRLPAVRGLRLALLPRLPRYGHGILRRPHPGLVRGRERDAAARWRGQGDQPPGPAVLLLPHLPQGDGVQQEKDQALQGSRVPGMPSLY